MEDLTKHSLNVDKFSRMYKLTSLTIGGKLQNLNLSESISTGPTGSVHYYYSLFF